MSNKQAALQPQHILCLEIENYKRISVFQAKFDESQPGVVVLSGDNEAGKSTVLDAIEMAVTGRMPTEPLRHGEKKGRVLLKTQDFEFVYRLTEKGAYFELMNAEGAVLKSPRTLLEKFYSGVAFDPLAFSQRLQPKEQAAELLRVCPVELDLAANAAEAKRLYDERTIANREVHRLEAVLASLPATPDEIPAVVSVADLTAQLDEIREEERKQEAKRVEAAEAARIHVEAEQALTTLDAGIAELEEKLQALKATRPGKVSELNKAAERVGFADQVVANLPDLSAPAAEVREKIASAESTNASTEQIRRDAARRVEATTELRKAVKQATALDAELNATQDARAEALRSAKFPVEGLSIDEAGMVRLHDVPLDQASTAQKIKLGVKLARAASKTMRIVLIRDGSTLDKKSMATLREEAENHGMQVWIERIEQDADSIKIVDGTNVTAKPEQVAA